MTPESRSSPLLHNGSLDTSAATDKKLTRVSMEMRILGDQFGTERVFHINGNNRAFHGYEQATNIFHGERTLYKRPCRQGDSDPRKTRLAGASSIYKRQTRPLVREGATQKQDRNCQIINIWSWATDWARHQDLLIDWPSVAMWPWLWLRFWLCVCVCGSEIQFPCGGGVEYLHRSPASRRRRQKGKSRIWGSKIWSQVPRDSDPRIRVNARARASSNCKWQIHPLVREDVI
jgi:hypothetical protein